MATTPASATSSATTSSTNLDVNSIVSQLMTVERQPIDKIQANEVSYQAQLTSYGLVKSALSGFETAVSGLNNTTKFQSLKATSSDDTAFSASATSIATAGTYSLEVTSLAKAQNLMTGGSATTTNAIGAGSDTTVTFDFGTIGGGLFTAYDPATKTGGTYGGAAFTGNGKGAYSITINSGNNTLEGIRDAINGAKVGVTAAIVNDGDATAPYRLVLTSGSLGASNSMRVTVSGDAAIQNLLAHNPAGTQNLAEVVTAKNANLKVNGVSVSKDSNSVSDVIHGVTLNLLKETTAPVTLTVANDTSAISTSVSSLVKAYNDMAGVLKTETSYNAAAKKGAALQGDATIRNLQAQMRNIMGSAVSGTSGALNTLSDIGLSFQRDGTLALDQAKLDKAMKSNFADISVLFSSDNGALTKLDAFTTSALASDGALANRTSGIGKTIADMDKRIASMETRLLSVEQHYRTQFTTLDSMLSSMNATSTYLTQQLAKL